ncbi:hypothetical protein [Thalassotalea aquiviva]|uniref:hypothetical protein n=1 Tax=Thalassotalea aquiviva TaxID=3242415 RepID=UPI00352A3AB6
MVKVFKTLVISLLIAPVIAFAAPNVEIKQIVEKEITMIVDGVQVTKRVPASEIEPGAVLFFTLSYKNSGDQVATQVAIDSPIPEGTTYVLGSALGEGAKVLVKLTNETDYQEEASAKVNFIDGETIPAQASDISALRWIVADIPPASDGKVSFQVEVNQ